MRRGARPLVCEGGRDPLYAASRLWWGLVATFQENRFLDGVSLGRTGDEPRAGPQVGLNQGLSPPLLLLADHCRELRREPTPDPARSSGPSPSCTSAPISDRSSCPRPFDDSGEKGIDREKDAARDVPPCEGLYEGAPIALAAPISRKSSSSTCVDGNATRTTFSRMFSTKISLTTGFLAVARCTAICPSNHSFMKGRVAAAGNL
mmetsp:Transcript_45391/g.107829  ORF Transcript_45391/g.107829 Transcript_45391/m.107829 type:complete len:205 (+) Transcript_45391:94-708(+)